MCVRMILTVFWLCVTLNSAFAQRSPGRVFDLNFDGMYMGESITLKNLQEPDLVGSVYLDDKWQAGDIILASGKKVGTFPIRFNVQRNVIEMKMKGKVYEMPGGNVKRFQMVDREGRRRVLINAADIGLYGNGFAEVLADKGVALLNLYRVEILQPTHNRALDLGEEAYRVKLIENCYLTDGSRYVKVPHKRKEAYSIFEDFNSQLGALAAEERINPRKSEQLVDLFQAWDPEG